MTIAALPSGFMIWIKRYGDIFCVMMAALYATLRNPQAGWTYQDTLIMAGLALLAISRILRMFKS